MLGNPGKRALPALSAVTVLPMADGTPDPPTHLELAGRAMWADCWHEGLTWIDPVSNRRITLSACELADAAETARAVYEATRARDDLRAFIAATEALNRVLAALGFTPADRTKLGLAEVKRVSKLDELAQRQATRRGR